MNTRPSCFGSLPSADLNSTKRHPQGAAAGYLDDLEQGVILLEHDGHVAFCSVEASRLLDLDSEIVGWSLRGLLTA
ncbi:MAG: hypothetical protein ACRYHQ_10635, partial [Janthinobacterium lividum]